MCTFFELKLLQTLSDRLFQIVNDLHVASSHISYAILVPAGSGLRLKRACLS